jgi:hypothetical protein
MDTTVEATEINAGGSDLDGLLPALQRLDRLLERAVGPKCLRVCGSGRPLPQAAHRPG